MTEAEAYGCPLPKVLGPTIARVFWRGIGKQAEVARVVVRVRGTIGLGRESYIDMTYELADLESPWAGDKDSSSLALTRRLKLSPRARA